MKRITSNLTKRTLSVLLSVLFISLAFSTNTNVLASSKFEYQYFDSIKYGKGNGYIFRVESGSTATIVSCNVKKSSVTIPKKLDKYKIIGIDGDYRKPFNQICAPYFDPNIKTLTIPSTISYIKSIDGAVYINGNLKKIKVDKSNKKLSAKNGVLYNKNKTTLIYYPPKKTNKKFTIPNSVTFIDNAITNNYLTTLNIPNSVKKVDWVQDFPCVASNCNALKTIKFGKGIKKLDYGTVMHCPNLTKVIIPKGVTVESDNTFYDCPKLKHNNFRKKLSTKKEINNVELNFKKGKNYIKVSWEDPLKIHFSEYGYEIQYSTNKKFKNKKFIRVYSKDKTNIKIKNLKSKKNYYFRIKSFSICNNNSSYDFGGVTLYYENTSKIKKIKAPSKCKVSKNLTKSKAQKIAIKRTVKNLNLTSTKNLYCNTTKFSFYGKKYYYIEVNARSPYSGGHSSSVNSQIISVDGTEQLYGKYGYSELSQKNCLLWIHV